MSLRSEDFESSASAVSPPRHVLRGGSSFPFLLPLFAGSYETKERRILPDATCVRQAAQVQVTRNPCAAGSHRASRISVVDASKFARRVEWRGPISRLFFREE